MERKLSKRRVFLRTFGAVMVVLFARTLKGQTGMPNEGEQKIAVVSAEPFSRWLGKPLKQLKASYVCLPWEDAVMGGADPYIGMTSKGDIYATTATFSKLWRSSDGGRTWTGSTLDLNPPLGRNPGDAVQNFGILKDDIFVIGYQVGNKYYASRSRDLGKTWEASTQIDMSPYEHGGGATHGFIHELSDGTILLPIHLYSGEEAEFGDALYLYRSKDGGRTWGDRSRVCFWGSEPDFLTLPSGRLLIAVRYQRCQGCILPSDPPELAEALETSYPKQVYVGESHDGGFTWKQWRRVTTGDFDVPGEFVRLSDGRLVLLYAHRALDPAPCGTWAMVSKDEGRTWENHRYLVNTVCERTTDWGFSASVALEDDTILTLSGCRGKGWPGSQEANKKSPGKIRAIRWRLDQDDTPQ